MKIYAKQVPPEYQKSPLDMDEWPENVFVFGNRYFTAHAERLEDTKQALEDIYDVCNGWSHYSKLADVMPTRDDGREYTRDERLTLARLAQNYAEYSYNSDDENALLCAALELITGQEYDYATIRGCCQGDWQNVIYPVEYGREWLCDFETEYFNTGTEWIVDDGMCVYAHGWRDDDIRAEIAEAVNVAPENIVLCKFTGWRQTAEYTEV